MKTGKRKSKEEKTKEHKNLVNGKEWKKSEKDLKNETGKSKEETK